METFSFWLAVVLLAAMAISIPFLAVDVCHRTYLMGKAAFAKENIRPMIPKWGGEILLIIKFSLLIHKLVIFSFALHPLTISLHLA